CCSSSVANIPAREFNGAELVTVVHTAKTEIQTQLMKIKVLKFGGTSVGDVQCFRRAIEIVADATKDSSVVVVVSAMSGVTNRLIAAAHQAARGDESGFRELAKSLEQGHGTAISELVRDGAKQQELFDQIRNIIAEMSNICHGITLLKELTTRAMAAVSCVGERLSARIMAAGLRDTAYLLKVSKQQRLSLLTPNTTRQN